MTDDNGKITVKLTAAADLGTAYHTEVALTPATSAGTALAAASIGATTVGTFLCGPGSTTPIDKKYLPGSCKN